MKKLLLLILFAVSLTAFAQVQIPQEYTIQKPLRLETVSAGSIADSVLVRGVDKIIKYVPRSEFTAGGGSQDLQQVLGNGSLSQIFDSTGKSYYSVNFSTSPEWSDTTFDQSFAGGSTRSIIRQYNGEFQLHEYTALGSTIIKFETPINNDVLLKFPTPSTGEYTFATTDDVAVAVNDSISGIVNNVALQELGGVDKLINGVRIGQGNTADLGNTALGTNALDAATTGSYNIGVGYQALQKNTTGLYNLGIGGLALQNNTTSEGNIGIGLHALSTLNGGLGYNVAVGNDAMKVATIGYGNVGLGHESLIRLTTGTFNMGVGNSTLQYVTTQTGNTAIGANAGAGVTGSKNTSIGYLANGFTTSSTGNYNVTIGYQAGRYLSTGTGNVLIETAEAQSGTTTGSYNIIINTGNRVSGITTGSNNTIIGGFGQSNISDCIVLANGIGVVGLKKEADNRLLAPTLTIPLIVSGGSTSLVNKAYTDQMGSVVNATASALSGTALNSLYPNAISLRVHCLNITGGGIVYEKSGSGWIKYTATAVAP